MKLLKIVKGILRRIYWLISLLFPIDVKKVVMSSYYGKGYGDNPKYIAEYILKNFKDIKIYWILKEKNDIKTLPVGITPCLDDSISSIFHLSTSKVWVDNCRKSVFNKRNKQYYIQTWHGFSLKRIEEDALNSLETLYIKNAKLDSKRINTIVSDSNFMTRIYSNSFWYDGEIIQIGSPRNDILINNRDYVVESVLKYFKIDFTKKIILYAPTFRKNNSLDAYDIDFNRLINTCENKFGFSFVLLIRMHPNIANIGKDIILNNQNIIDASNYPDMQELLATAYVVISDYSSLMFDFSLSGKPCFQYANDINDYKKDRNFYFELDNLPFELSTSNDELERNIKNFNENLYHEKLEVFFNKVGMVREGNASKKIACLIREICS